MTEKSIAAQIEALHAMTGPQLQARFEELFGCRSSLKHKKWLLKRCAWKIQERHYGGLSDEAKSKLEELIAQVKFPLGRRRTCTGQLTQRTRGNLAIGTILSREYQGQEIVVTVVESGFEWNQVVYGSLTAVAKAVTGSRWNGKLFFGLTERTKKS